MFNVKKQRNFWFYVQNIFKYVKIVEMKFVFNQIIMIWNNFDWEFRRDIFESIAQIIIRQFLNQFDNKVNIWYEITRRNSIINFIKMQNRLNKQKKRNRQNEFFSSFNESNVFLIQYWFVEYYVFAQKQIYQKQSFDQSKQRRIQNAFLLIKQFFLLIFENASNLKN